MSNKSRPLSFICGQQMIYRMIVCIPQAKGVYQMIQPSTSLIHLIVIQNIQHGLKLEAHKSEGKSCCPSSPNEVFTQFFFIGSDPDILFFSDTDPSNVKTWIRILIYGPKFIRIYNIVIRPVIKIPDKNWPDLSPPAPYY